MKCTLAMRPERGFAAVAAIFVLVVLAGLGAALVTVFGGQQRSQAYDVLGMKAYQSARAGIENGLHQALRNGVCPPATASYDLGGQLSGFSVTIDCVSSAHTDPGPMTIYEITATACNRPATTCPANGAGDGYVERQLRASACRGDC
jgi:MSHA biogenesis protein MshP